LLELLPWQAIFDAVEGSTFEIRSVHGAIDDLLGRVEQNCGPPASQLIDPSPA